MGAVERRLEGRSAVPGGCGRCVFTNCRDVPPERLRVLSVWGSPEDDVPVEFRDADGEVRIPRIIIGPQGSVKAVVRNQWSNGVGSGRYSLL